MEQRNCTLRNRDLFWKIKYFDLDCLTLHMSLSTKILIKGPLSAKSYTIPGKFDFVLT